MGEALCLEVPSCTSLQGANLVMKMRLSAWKPHHALPCRMQLDLSAWKSVPSCTSLQCAFLVGQMEPYLLECFIMHFLAGCNFCLHCMVMSIIYLLSVRGRI